MPSLHSLTDTHAHTHTCTPPRIPGIRHKGLALCFAAMEVGECAFAPRSRRANCCLQVTTAAAAAGSRRCHTYHRSASSGETTTWPVEYAGLAVLNRTGDGTSKTLPARQRCPLIPLHPDPRHFSYLLPVTPLPPLSLPISSPVTLYAPSVALVPQSSQLVNN